MDETPNIYIPERCNLIDNSSKDFPSIIEDTEFEAHYPIGFTESTTDPLQFFIKGTESWIDFSQSVLFLKGQIIGESTTDKDGKKAAGLQDNTFFLEDNFFHSLFSAVDVSVNGTSTSPHNSNYPYTAYIQNRCNFTSDQVLTMGALFGYNKTKEERNKLIFDSAPNTVSGVIPIKSPLFNCPKDLISFSDVRIILTRVQKGEFYFRYSTGSYSFKIIRAILFVRKNKIRAEFQAFIESYLAQGNLLRWFMNDFRSFTKTYSGLGTDIIEDNLFHSIVPKTLVFGFVDNNAYNGSKDKNPFKFENLDKKICEIAIYVNGRLFPYPQIKMDFETNETHLMYNTTMTTLGGHDTPDPPIITKSQFDNGEATLFAFNFCTDQKSGRNQTTLFNQPATVRIHVKLKEPLPSKNVTLVAYYEVQSLLSCNKSRGFIFESK